jgi:hypothetical protein
VHKREFDLKIALFTRDEAKKALATKSKQKMVKSKKDTVGDFPNFCS